MSEIHGSELTQALAHSHAVLLGVEIVAVASAASVDEAHALPLAHVEGPAGHGCTAGASLSLQGAHSCQRTAVRASHQQGQHSTLLLLHSTIQKLKARFGAKMILIRTMMTVKRSNLVYS